MYTIICKINVVLLTDVWYLFVEGIEDKLLWMKGEDKTYGRRISTGISHLSMEIGRNKIRKINKEKERQNKQTVRINK